MRTASRVFGAIGIFAFAAALLFAASGHNRAAIQGTLVLGLFGLANAYLWRALGHGGRGDLDGLILPGAGSLDEVRHNDPGSLHLPGPSIFPAVYAVAAGLILVGLLINPLISYVGAAFFLVASIGWGLQAVGEYRFAQSHGVVDDQAGAFDHVAIDLAHQVAAFRSLHGGATASVQHLGRGHGRIVLVGADGEWGDVVTHDLAAAEQACSLGGVEAPSAWPAGLGARMRSDRDAWERMGGQAPAAAHGPRDGYTQVGARVFLSIGVFAFVAAALFAISGHNKSAIQGTVLLSMFGIANVYLYVFMRNAHGGPDDAAYAAASGIAAEPMDPAPAMNPEDIHLPGPSIWPALFSLAAGLILIGLITNPAVSLVGLGLFVLAAIGWVAQAVGEYRLAQAGGHAGAHGVDDGAVPVDHVADGQTH